MSSLTQSCLKIGQRNNVFNTVLYKIGIVIFLFLVCKGYFVCIVIIFYLLRVYVNHSVTKVVNCKNYCYQSGLLPENCKALIPYQEESVALCFFVLAHSFSFFIPLR